MRSWHGAALGAWVLLSLRPTVPAAPPAPDPLRFTLAAPESVRRGESVPIVLRLTNPTDRPVDAYFLGRTITFDIVVSREDGTVVWRRLEGAVVPGILQVRTLAQGETLEWREVWRQQTNAGSAVGPGTYVLRGILPSDAPEPRRTPEVRVGVS